LTSTRVKIIGEGFQLEVKRGINLYAREEGRDLLLRVEDGDLTRLIEKGNQKSSLMMELRREADHFPGTDELRILNFRLVKDPDSALLSKL
jgi:hypothetical protein